MSEEIMKQSIKRLIHVLIMNLDTDEKVSLFSKIPKKGLPITNKTPSKTQNKIINEDLKNNRNIEFMRQYLQTHKLHRLIERKELFENIDYSDANRTYEFIENNEFNIQIFCELIIYMFENLDCEQIENLFPDVRIVDRVLQSLTKIERARPNETENKPEIEKLLNQHQKDLNKKNKIISDNKKKYQQVSEKIQRQHAEALQKLTKKFEDKLSSADKTVENLKLTISDLKDQKSKLKNDNDQLQQKIKILNKELSEKYILLIADRDYDIDKMQNYRVFQLSEDDGLDKVLDTVSVQPINEIWVVKEQVSGLFIHKLSIEMKFIKIQQKSIKEII